MEFTSEKTFEEISRDVSNQFASRIGFNAEELEKRFLEGSRTGATPISHGAALPHIRLPEIKKAEMILVRTIQACHVRALNFSGKTSMQGPIHAFFFLVSPNENPGQHLRILAQIAGRVDDENFIKDWMDASNDQELKEILLRDERFFSLIIRNNTSSSELIGNSLREIRMPEGCLVALIRRKGETIVPRGLTELMEGDRLTIIGDAKGIEQLIHKYN